MSEEKMRELRDQLVADINRPDGRWGMHGHSCVDDDYFQALYYVVGRIDEVLAQPAALVEIPDQLYDSYAVFKRAEASCPSLQGHQVRHVLDAVVALIRETNQEKGHAE